MVSNGDGITFSDAGLIQADRILRISTPLGTDILLPEKMQVREEVNGLFEVIVSVKSKRIDIKPEEIVGIPADVSIEIAYGERRPWNGLVTDLHEGPPVSRGLRSYQLTLRPQLWLLSQRSDHRIWMDQSSVDVMQTLLSEHGIKAAVTGGIITPPPPEHYSVQYGETDLAYLTRRLETDGLFYWFEHKEGEHTLHVASHTFGYTEGPETNVRLSAGSTDRNHLTGFERHYQFTPGKRTGGDWNFEMPRGPQGATTPSLVSLPKNSDYELFEYPAKALDQAANERASKLRMQAVEADHEKISGESSVRTLAAGRKFKPYDVAHAEHIYEEYVVTGILHTIIDHSYETIEDGSLDYSNSFIALPSRLPATPHRTTPRPRIDGVHIAIVSGPPGEEIHVDEYGRVKLWFPWQRQRAKKDGSDTKWIEVVQNWGGGTWGARTNPRVGMQAICSHENGDPDRPYVIGLVANPDNMSPYKLPDHKTKTVIRSNTYKGDGTGFNEYSTEDAPGRESQFFHAQKDQATKVLNNQTSRVDANAVHSVGANKSLEVGANMSHQVGGGLNMVVGGVGGVVNAIAGGQLAGLASKSAGMLQQAMGIVTAAAANSPSSSNKNAQTAAAAVGEGGGSGQADESSGSPDEAGAHAAAMAAGALGSMLSGMDQTREGINAATVRGLRTEGGASMNDAGVKLGSQVASMIGKGIFNTLVSKMQNTSVGIAQTEQVGVAKVVTVGQVYNQTVGSTKNIMIGKELYVGVGGGTDKDGNEIPPKSILIMKDDGTILLKGVRIYIDAESHVQIIAPMQDNN